MGGEKLITVIVPRGKGLELLRALHGRRALRAALATARAPFTFVKGRGALARTVRHSVEKDVLHVITAAEEAEGLFDFLHQAAGIAAAPGSFMFMGVLARASEFTLPAD
jgi:hypothetical protein